MRAWLVLILSISLLIVSGCASMGNASIKDRPADWPPLTMTKTQLIKELGPPSSQGTKASNGKTTDLYGWIYAEAVGLTSTGKALSVEFDGETMVSRTWSTTPKPN